jgi:2-oxoglutarate dehydrogenase E2 component (dihydrolipoamide succinyltransferase)
MIIEIKIPGAGESITEVAIGSWLAEDGAFIAKDQEIAEVETDKATLPLIASDSGKLKIIVAAGQRVQVGDIACTIDTTDAELSSSLKKTIDKPAKPVIPSPTSKATAEDAIRQPKVGSSSVRITPLAQNIMNQNNLNVDEIINGLKKITRHEVELVINNRVPKPPAVHTLFAGRESERTPMSPLRRKLSKRLVAVKNETAMLTTFNELDMSSLLEIRKKYQSQFQDKHGQKLGLMSFFAKACAEALKLFPRVNSLIDGEDIITPHFIDIAIAVQTDKGLMVPVIRNAHTMSLAQLEITIADLAQKAKATKLTIEEMTGGTFTITNGGVFGSMLSTPILNPPQSAILGMHNIVERPVVNNGNIEIRPIMYIALSYDHRLIDGRDSVSFLVKVKELIESPLKMVLEGADPEKILLNL